MTVNTPEKRLIIRSIVTAAILFVIDTFLLNQGVIAVITLAIVILALLPKAIYHQVKKLDPRPQFYRCLIYTVMAFLVFGSNYINNRIAHHRAAALIASIEEYKNDKGTFPNDLEALIPEYIDSVPLAKYTLMSNRFRYVDLDGEPFLFYVALPPFGRPTYNFTRQKWVYID